MKRLLLGLAIGVATSFAQLAAQSSAPQLGDFKIRALEEAMRNPDRHVANSQREATLGEQVAAGIGLIFVMAIVIAGAVGIAYFCERARDYFTGQPHISKEQRDFINAWGLRQIGLGRATWRTAPLLVPSQDDLRVMAAELRAEN